MKLYVLSYRAGHSIDCFPTHSRGYKILFSEKPNTPTREWENKKFTVNMFTLGFYFDIFVIFVNDFYIYIITKASARVVFDTKR